MSNIYEVFIGSDEAGKGEWLGPLVVSAVATTTEQNRYFVTQGVMDSKQLKIPVILELAKLIKKTSLSYYVVTITPQRFNELIQEIKSEGKSLNDLLAWGHATAINQVYNTVRGKGFKTRVKVFIDEFDQIKTEKRLARVLKMSDLDVEQKPKAEQETPVAAASIIARAEREIWIERESKILGLDLGHISASEVLNLSNAAHFAKLSFLQPHAIK
jgi:ribonuclease HIII